MTAYDFTVYGKHCNGVIVVVAETREEAIDKAQTKLDRWKQGSYTLDASVSLGTPIDGATIVHFDDGER